MTNKLKANIIKAACDTANAIAKADHEAGNLANALLKSVHEGREAGLAVDTIWAEIARAGGYQDKAAKLEGVAMPKTLQVYRAKHRKVPLLQLRVAPQPSAARSHDRQRREGVEGFGDPRRVHEILLAPVN